MIFQERDPAISIQIASAAAPQAEAIENRLRDPETSIEVLGEDTGVLRATAEEDATPVGEGEVVLVTGPEDKVIGNIGTGINEGPAIYVVTPVSEPSAPSSSSSGGNIGAVAALVAGGAQLAALLFDWFDSEDEDEAAVWEEERTHGGARTSFADLRSGYPHESRSRAVGVEGWTRAFTGDSPVLAGGAEGTVQGVAMGLDTELGRGFHIGVAALPDMAASSRPGPASGLGASLEGGLVRGAGRLERTHAVREDERVARTVACALAVREPGGRGGCWAEATTSYRTTWA